MIEIPKSLIEFYGKVDKIIVYPGSLRELNGEKITGISHKIMPLEGSFQYLSGILLKPLDDLNKDIRCECFINADS